MQLGRHRSYVFNILGERWPDKAIDFEEFEATDRNGATTTIRQPHVDPDPCIGCGVCENVCPCKDRPGVRVSSTNETLHPDNQPILLGAICRIDGESGSLPALTPRGNLLK